MSTAPTNPTSPTSLDAVPPAPTTPSNPLVPKPLVTQKVETIFVFNESKFQQAVQNQEKYLEAFIGKKGHNPFFQLHRLLDMRKEYSNGDRSEKLYSEAMAFKQESPSFGHKVPEPVTPKK